MPSCPQPEWRSGRLLRAAAFTLLSSVLAVVAHHLAAGDAAPRQSALGGAALGGAAVTFALSWLVTRASRPWWQVVMATCAAQLGLHRALSVRQPAFPCCTEAHGGMQGGTHRFVPQIVRAAHHGVWPMTAAHCVAACAMALLMYRADQVLSRLPQTVGRWAQRAAAAAAAALGALRRPWFGPRPRTGPVRHDGRAVRPAATTTLCHAVVRRGPPAGCAGDVPLIPAGSAPAR